MDTSAATRFAVLDEVSASLRSNNSVPGVVYGSNKRVDGEVSLTWNQQLYTTIILSSVASGVVAFFAVTLARK
jgi:hypothetical protein